MEFISEFFGSLLDNFYSMTNEFISATAIYSACCYILYYLIEKKHIHNMFLSVALNSTVSQVNGKIGKYNEDVAGHVLISHGYSIFAAIFTYIVKALMGLGLVFALKSVYLADKELSFLGSDLKQSILNMFKAESCSPWLIVVPLISVVLQFLINKIFEERTIVNNTVIDMVEVALTTVGAIMLPFAINIYWIICSVIEFAVLEYFLHIAWNKELEKTQKTMGSVAKQFERKMDAQVKEDKIAAQRKAQKKNQRKK